MTAKAVPNQKPHLWSKGKSGNPKGKAPGTRNKATMAALTLLEGEASKLTRKAVELALEGDIQALRLCLERIIAPTKDRPLKITLPAVETAADLPKLTVALLAAVAAENIGASEAATLARLVEAHGKALETADFEERLRKIEEAQR
jgi:hypothetical protein